jgi:hypothetical protein
MGKITRSWDLIGQSFRVLKADKELMWLPVLSAIFCIFVTTQLFFWSVLLYYPSIAADLASHTRWRPTPAFLSTLSFLLYFLNYSVITFFNTALVGAATIRLQGGDPTLEDGLRVAWRRKGVILQWALVAATIGTVLKMIEDRASFIGKLVVGLIGLAWTLASFLVVPILAFEGVGPFEALRRSSELFRKTWGEEVAGGVSFGLIFLFLTIPGVLFPIAGHAIAAQKGLLVGLALLVIYILLLSVISSATHGIFVAALYRYATSGEIPPGFDRYNFSKAWQPRNPW